MIKLLFCKRSCYAIHICSVFYHPLTLHSHFVAHLVSNDDFCIRVVGIRNSMD